MCFVVYFKRTRGRAGLAVTEGRPLWPPKVPPAPGDALLVVRPLRPDLPAEVHGIIPASSLRRLRRLSIGERDALILARARDLCRAWGAELAD